MRNKIDIEALRPFIGDIIRSTRVDQGYTIYDLEDDEIKKSTISKIENGRRVNEEKLLYLLQKLKIELEDIPKLIELKKSNREDLLLELEMIENMIELADADKALEKLDAISNNPEFDPFAAEICYLKSKCAYAKKQWIKAQNYLFKSIEVLDKIQNDLELASKDSDQPSKELEVFYQSNLRSCCLHELSRTSFFLHDVEQALEYIDQGIEFFNPNGDRKYIGHVLLLNRINYLDKLGRVDEALQELNELWRIKDKIINVNVLLNMYDLKANLLMKFNLYTDAIVFAKKGIKLARISFRPDYAFQLWTTLGQIYVETDQLSAAETSFHMALELQDLIGNKKEHLFLPTYYQLGRLYQKQANWKKAIKMYEEALKHSGSTLRQKAVYIGLGECYFNLEEMNQSIKWYKKAANQIRKTLQAGKLTNQDRICVVGLAECYRKQGSMDEYNSYLELLLKIEVTLLKENRS